MCGFCVLKVVDSLTCFHNQVWKADNGQRVNTGLMAGDTKKSNSVPVLKGFLGKVMSFMM